MKDRRGENFKVPVVFGLTLHVLLGVGLWWAEKKPAEASLNTVRVIRAESFTISRSAASIAQEKKLIEVEKAKKKKLREEAKAKKIEARRKKAEEEKKIIEKRRLENLERERKEQKRLAEEQKKRQKNERLVREKAILDAKNRALKEKKKLEEARKIKEKADLERSRIKREKAEKIKKALLNKEKERVAKQAERKKEQEQRLKKLKAIEEQRRVAEQKKIDTLDDIFEKAEAEALRHEKELEKKAEEQRIIDELNVLADLDSKQAVANIIIALTTRISRCWKKPASFRGGLKVSLRMNLAKDGELVAVQVADPSGNPAFDRSGILAVKKCAPYREIEGFSRRVFDKEFRVTTVVFRPEG